jgi:VWFA-related protein
VANSTLTILLSASLCVSLSAQSAPPTSAQSPKLTPRTHEERERRYQAAHRIYLNVRVADSAGQPISGLGSKDFILFEDHKEREIENFRLVDASSTTTYNHVVLMLDAVNNSPRSVQQSRKEIARYLNENHEPLAFPLAIGVLSEYGARVGLASRDRSVLLAHLKALTSEDLAWDCGNEVNLNDGFMAVWMPGSASALQLGSESAKAADCQNRRFLRSVSALSQLAKKQSDVAGRMILIWFGSGWPLLSSHEWRRDSTTFKEDNFHYLAELSTDLREQQITLDSVSDHDLYRLAEWRGERDNSLLNGVRSEDLVTASSFALQVLAHQSGGLILENSKDVARDISRCIADASAYYALSFNALPTEKPDDFHSISIKVDRPGAVARTETVYYGQP